MAPRQEANQGDLKNSKYNKLAVKIAAGFAVGATALNLVGCGDTVKATPAPEQTPTAAAPQVPGPEQPTTKETTKAPEANLSIFAEKSSENLKPFNWEDAGTLFSSQTDLMKKLKKGDIDEITSTELNPALKYLESYVKNIDGPLSVENIKQMSTFGELEDMGDGYKRVSRQSTSQFVTAKNFIYNMGILNNPYVLAEVEKTITEKDYVKLLDTMYRPVDIFDGVEGADDLTKLTPTVAQMNAVEMADKVGPYLVAIEDFKNEKESVLSTELEPNALTANTGTSEPGSKSVEYVSTFTSLVLYRSEGKDAMYTDAADTISTITFKTNEENKIVLAKAPQTTVVTPSVRNKN